MKKTLLALTMLIVSCSWAFAQEHQVSGKVTGSDGNPLPGITIQVSGTNTGTATAGDGTYSLSAANDATLIFRGIGFDEQTVPVANRSVIDVILQSGTAKLNELVVTALGVSREKKSLGYAVQSVDSKLLNQGANPNLNTALQGKVSGLEVRPSSGMPGASAQIYIRGARFFSGDNAPLYVVDGMPINSGPDFVVGGDGVTGTDYSDRAIDIDPDNIASISVLKGQAASALYGTRASNGVIMITTRNGSHLTKGKPVISFSTNYQFARPSRYPDIQSTYAQGSGGVFTPGASTSWGPKISDLPNDPDYGGNVPNDFNDNNPTSATQGKFWDPYKDAWESPLAYNNPKNFFRTGLTATNNLSISQAGDLGSYTIGVGATNQTGIVKASDMNRYNANFAGNFNASEKVKVGANVHFSSTDIDKIPSGNNSLFFEIYGAPPSYDLMGSPISDPNDPYSQVQYRGGTFDNPLWSAKYNKFNEKTRRIFGDTYISYTPLAGLNVKYQVGMDQYTTGREEIWSYGSGNYPTGDLVNGAFINRTLNSLLNVTYNKQLNDDWHINALVGNEINDNFTRDQTSEGSGFIIPGWNNMSNASTQTSTEAKEKKRTVGFYGQVGADWKSMLFLNITGRNDFISTMPSANQSFFYPSASLSWVFSELPGLSGNGFTGKLRTSYAQVGAPGTFKERIYLQGVSGSGFLSGTSISYPFNGVIGFRPDQTLYDPNLKPQNTNSYEIGTDLSFLHNRISLSYTYTNQDTKDQIFAIPLAGSTGYAEIMRNAGEMRSQVHEATLDVIPVKTSDFQWDATINFTKVINKVIALAPGVDNIYLGGFVDPQVRAAIGYTYPSIYGTTFLKNDKGQVIIDDDPNSDTYGMPLTGTDGVIGSVTPKFILAMNNSFQYKSFRLSFLVEWKNGGQMYSGANRLIDLYGTSKATADRDTKQLVWKGVKASTVEEDNKGDYIGGTPNDIVIKGADNFETLYGSITGNISEAQVYGTSFVKLRSAALSYDLPQDICERTRFFRTAAISVSVSNVLLWSEMPNFDPEASQGNGNMQGGFDYMSLPQTSSYGVGLNFTF